MADKAVFIGLDGADPEVISEWISAGELPTFKMLQEAGASCPMLSTVPPLSAPAWISIYTGKNPAKHGICDFFYMDSKSRSMKLTSSNDIKAETIWSLLSRAGKRVILLNMPMTYPPEPVNGVMSTGLHTPSEESPYTYPESFKDELYRITKGRYQISAGPITSKNNIKDYIARLNDVTDAQMDAAMMLLRERPWDLFMYVVQGTDQIQHALWHLSDREHPRYYSKSGYESAILDYYKKVDHFVSRVIKETGGSANIFIASDHGFGPLHGLIDLNNILTRHGFIVFKRSFWTMIKRLIYAMNITPLSAFNLLISLGLGKKRDRVTKGREYKRLKKIFLSFDDVDWTRTKAYALGNGGCIYLNRSYRHEKDTRSELMDLLYSVKDKSGYKVIDRLFKKEDIFKGPFMNNMPDIVFWPEENRYFPLGAYEFPSNKVINYAESPTGAHRSKGIFMAYGKDILQGKQPEGMTVCNVAPTILYSMGMRAATGFDGKAIDDIFCSRKVGQSYVREVALPASLDPLRLSEKEEDELRRNLHGLGYI